MWTEESAGPGWWKPAIVGVLGLCLMAAAFVVPPGPPHIYTNWLIGVIAGNAALMMPGNRLWERPLAAGAAIWLFISGFVPSVLTGQAWLVNELSIGAAMILASLSASVRLRDDVRQARPLTM